MTADRVCLDCGISVSRPGARGPWPKRCAEHHAEWRRSERRRRYALDPEKHRKRSRNDYDANMERRRERARQWRAANPAMVHMFTLNRRARQRGAAVVESIKLDDLWIRDGGICHICGKRTPRENASVDHLIPLSKSGDHSWVNVALAHRRCNSRRGAGRIPAQLRLVG